MRLLTSPMAILPRDVREYLDALLPDPGEGFREIEREGAELSKRAPWFTPCDRAVGALLDFMIRVSGARTVLELGTSVGHSTAWIARALPPGGKLTTVDRDAPMIARARANLGRLGLAGKVVFVQAEHLDYLKDGRGPVDLIFYDGGKERMVEALSHLARLLRPGGLLLGSGVLWGGEVARPAPPRPRAGRPRELIEETAGFNRAVCNHPEMLGMVLPIGDGVTVARRHDA